MASDAYWNATKPNGMPDYVWKAQQAAKKAEEEAKKAAEEAAKKKEAEEAAKKRAEAAKKEVGNKPNTTNTASAKKSEATSTSNKTSSSSSNSSSNKGLTSEDARAEKVATKNNTTPKSTGSGSTSASSSSSKSSSSSTNTSSSGAYNTAKQSVANTNPTSYNTSQYYAAQALQNAGQTVPTPKTPIEEYLEDVQKYSTATAIANSTPSTSYNTAELEAAKAVNAARDSRIDKLNEATTPVSPTVEEIVQAIVNTGLTTEDARDEKIAIKNGTTPEYAQKDNGYVPVADLNRPTNGSGVIPKPDNSGLTTEDARKEHIGIMNNPTINPPTDGQISAGAIIPQETIDQITQLIQNNKPTVDPYVPTDYVKGDYTPLFPQGDATLNPTLNTTSDAVAQYALAIMQAAKGDLGEVVKPEYMQADKPNTPELRTLEELANTYGITYDYDSIYKILNDSVEKQYDAIYQRQKQNEDAYYDNAVAAQNTLLDTLSRDRSSAVQAGVSKGMQAANALGAMLGVSQQFANNATALSQERSNTAKDYGASLAKAVVDAEATSNERKNAIMEISKMLYGYDSEQYVANMDNYNTILTNNAALQQTYMNNQTALQNALASIYNNSASSKITGDANIQASQATAEANRYAAYQAAEAQRYAAHQAAEANKAAAASAAQGNVDAYEKYANALIQQALIGSGQSSLGGYEVPKADGTGTGTTTGTSTTAKKNPSAYTNAANAANNTAANIVANLALKLIGK